MDGHLLRPKTPMAAPHTTVIREQAFCQFPMLKKDEKAEKPGEL
jgi:hypothetical protein